MSSPQQDAFIEAAATARTLKERSYGIALPALATEYGSLNQALAQGGEPGYVKDAYQAARGGTMEDSALRQKAALGASQRGRSGIVGGGNVGATISPQALGSDMAQALYGTRVQEAAGNISQVNKLMGIGLGQTQQAGSGALAATENQLQNISGMQNYNSTYAGILGALNLGGSLYGAGAFGRGQQPMATPYDPAPGLTSGYGG